MSYLKTLSSLVVTCTNCDLCKTRCRPVFGTGNVNASIVCIGEAPGAEEDKTGIPFVGRSGKLLTSLLEEAGLPRDSLFITNTVKCRPPNNRPPNEQEILACKYYLEQQIETIKPKLLLIIGGTAAKAVLNTKEPVGSLRGKFGDIQFSNRCYITMVIYHPSYLLRNSSREPESPISITLRDLRLVAKITKGVTNGQLSS